MGSERQPTSPFAWLVCVACVALALGFLPAAPTIQAQHQPAPGNSSGSVHFTEQLLQDGYGYAFGLAAADLDGDGRLDLVSADTTNNRLFWFANDGQGKFSRHLIAQDEPGWLERL